MHTDGNEKNENDKAGMKTCEWRDVEEEMGMKKYVGRAKRWERKVI